MSSQSNKNNGLNETETTSCEGVAPGMHEVPDPASAGRHQATDQTKKENEVGKCSKQDCN